MVSYVNYCTLIAGTDHSAIKDDHLLTDEQELCTNSARGEELFI
jgi:hypothetical protein